MLPAPSERKGAPPSKQGPPVRREYTHPGLNRSAGCPLTRRMPSVHSRRSNPPTCLGQPVQISGFLAGGRNDSVGPESAPPYGSCGRPRVSAVQACEVSVPSKSSGSSTFSQRFDDAVKTGPWTSNGDVAAAIASAFAEQGLGLTNRVKVSMWRNGRATPPPLVQQLLLAWIDGVTRGAATRSGHTGRRASCVHVVSSDKEWYVKVAGAEQVQSRHKTQMAATKAARDVVRDSGGGRIVVRSSDGSFLSTPVDGKSAPVRDRQ